MWNSNSFSSVTGVPGPMPRTGMGDHVCHEAGRLCRVVP